MNEPRRFRFTLRELLLVVLILGAALGLSVSYIERAREAARRNGCGNKLKQLGLGCENFENAKEHFPLASDRVEGLIVPGKNDPGLPSGATDAMGFSWMVSVLPFQCILSKYDDIRYASNKFHQDPFNAHNVSTRVPGNFVWQAAANEAGYLFVLHCPSLRGDHSCIGAHSPTRYQNAAPERTNYLALVGTHYDPSTTPQLAQNGVIVGSDAVPTDPNFKGVKLDDIKDGTSNTVLLCESREATYASWYDGSTASTLGHPEASVPSVHPASGQLVAGEMGLNFGPDGGHPDRSFFTPGGFYFGLQRRWGPSSMHPGGLVNVCFVDDSVRTFRAAELDPDIWLRLITRADGEAPVGQGPRP